MKKQYFLMLILIISSIQLSAQSFEWSATVNSTSFNAGRNGIADNKGNVYYHGEFRDTIDCDPSSGVFNMISPPSVYSVFIIKLDSLGNLVWAKQFDGGSLGSFNIDNSNNLLFTFNATIGTIDLDPGATSYLVTTRNFSTTLVKLDENGNFIWGQILDSPQASYGYGITSDDNDNIYWIGYYQDTLYVNKNSRLDYLLPVDTTSHFLMKLDKNGDYVWSNTIGFSSANAAGIGNLKVVGSDLYAYGSFNDTMITNYNSSKDTVISNGSYDIVINKLDTNGNSIWLKSFGGTGSDYGSLMKIDNSGNFYLLGVFTDTMDVNLGLGTNNITTEIGNTDNFLLKLDNNTNFLWVNTWGTEIEFSGMVLDGDDNIFLSATTRDTIDIDPSANVVTLTPVKPYLRFGFFMKLDPQNNFGYAHQILSTNGLFLNSLSSNDNSMFLVGSYLDSTYLDPINNTDLNIAPAASTFNAFCVRVSVPFLSVGLTETENNELLSIYPNPTSALLTIDTRNEKIESIRIFNSAGKLITTIVNGSNTLDVSSLKNGLYIIQIQTKNSRSTSRFIKK